MTSNPASRSARATTFAPRSCPSRPGLATMIRYFSGMAAIIANALVRSAEYTLRAACDTSMRGQEAIPVPPARAEADDEGGDPRPLSRAARPGLGHRAAGRGHRHRRRRLARVVPLRDQPTRLRGA